MQRVMRAAVRAEHRGSVDEEVASSRTSLLRGAWRPGGLAALGFSEGLGDRRKLNLRIEKPLG